MITNILLTGVGGQGILLAARIIASAARSAGFDVTTNEIHGMAQRGGSVTAQIRFGEEVLAALRPRFDEIDSARWSRSRRCVTAIT